MTRFEEKEGEEKIKEGEGRQKNIQRGKTITLIKSKAKERERERDKEHSELGKGTVLLSPTKKTCFRHTVPTGKGQER